jgi:hypothetical protein
MEAVEEQETDTMQPMQDTPHPESAIPQRLLQQPTMCAECSLLIGANQLADECELCGAPRCRACANEAGDGASARSTGGYICSACAAEA